jgi:hypothetical protein
MKPKTKFAIAAVVLGLLLNSCGSGGTNTDTSKAKNMKRQSNVNATKKIMWDFDNLIGWQDATQSRDNNYFIDNTYLQIFTNADSWDRVKIKTVTTHTTGVYS